MIFDKITRFFGNNQYEANNQPYNQYYVQSPAYRNAREAAEYYKKSHSVNNNDCFILSSNNVYENPLDKYVLHKNAERMSLSHEDWVKSRKDLFGSDMSFANCFAQCIPQDAQHGAWKMHLYSADEADWRKMSDVVIPYLRDKGVIWKTFNLFCDAQYLNGTQQEGKAFTIYPKDNDNMAEIATDLDYIIRNNNLEKDNSYIVGDRQMGNTGRLFYRYELCSGKFKDDIYDMNNKDSFRLYHMRYDSNRGEGKYLAEDMTPEDDIWLNFDPNVVFAEVCEDYDDEDIKVVSMELKQGEWYKLDNLPKIEMVNYIVDLSQDQIKERLNNLNNNESISIGREGDILVPEDYKYVSRKHVYITNYNGELYLLNNSKNPTNILFE